MVEMSLCLPENQRVILNIRTVLTSLTVIMNV